ncbi:putative COP9 subunit 3 [Aspergillus clavatus NRRL 1]|uniref:COP9 signalosome complex subunit 3 N-terminal helical repeats domain-containing protein n=1 Tax=Aspergillus clavatus (strain ATCC 1007 / CBS 513.65 / DSM 816 / NCTC 3887 / NRRL 1 / QM 1276 / 107) TaxID=344612 RepID=A1CSG7_ASPCL|nr:uncharacterized protein ACLA_079380 [Aspergillus clavatus NRRL 1]EAW06254.1 conserved hypothetical protein [Aspergillus clavatus NRRL 1]
MTEILARLTAPSAYRYASCEILEDYGRQLRELIAYIKQPRTTADIATAAEFLLDNLDPSLHSASYLFVLHAEIKNHSTKYSKHPPDVLQPGQRLWSKAVECLSVFDPVQVRYAGYEWRQLIELVAQAAQATSKTFLAVQVIKNAILRLDPSSSTFTSTHVLFAKICLSTKSYRHALPVLDKTMCYLPPDTVQCPRVGHGGLLCSEHESNASYITFCSGLSANLTHRDHLEYFLYGAMIYMALKDWDRALHFLSIVISCPVTNAVSMIMIQGYKKWLLVSLLGKGRVVTPPEIISPHVMKVYQSMTLPYRSLACAFENGDVKILQAEIDAGQKIWAADHNMGLVVQTIRALRRSVIVRLGKTFSALATLDVGPRIASFPVSAAELEALISSMLMSEGLGSTLLHSQSHDRHTMLRFQVERTPRSIREGAIQFLIDLENRSLSTLACKIDQSNHDLGLTSEQLQFIRRAKNSAELGYQKGGMTFSDDTVNQDIDEDIMGDH